MDTISLCNLCLVSWYLVVFWVKTLILVSSLCVRSARCSAHSSCPWFSRSRRCATRQGDNGFSRFRQHAVASTAQRSNACPLLSSGPLPHTRAACAPILDMPTLICVHGGASNPKRVWADANHFITDALDERRPPEKTFSRKTWRSRAEGGRGRKHRA